MHAQETGSLLKGLVAQSWHQPQLFATAELAVVVSKLNNIVSNALAQASDATQQGGRGGVDFNANGVDTVFNY